ncbi:MAG: helix-turn-helix domain-containing protein [Candidatus Omnitrophica bacterium]|nr:helix-turn-helix domain-containing protein [Candidatus Omnitrophota bacterium]
MTAGARLQQARGERKLALSDVTKETKIQPWVLEALEADRLQEMMSPIYVKGFLTTYARFLRLDPDPLLADVRWPEPEPAQEEVPPTPSPAPMTMRLPLPLVKRVGVAVAIGLIVVVGMRVHPMQRLGPRSQHRHQGTATAAQTKKSAAQHARTSPVREPAREAAKPSTKPFPSQTLTQPTVTAQVQPSAPTEPPAPQLASLSVALDTLKPPAPPSFTLLPSQPLELLVSAERTTWVRIKADGKLLTQQRIQRGAHERWVAKKRFEIIVSKPSQVALMLNGQSISSFAIAHQGRLLITHQGIVQLPEDE